MTIVLQNARKEDHQHTRPHRQREIDRHIRSLESWRGRESGKKLPANTQNGNTPRPKTANKNTKQNKKHCRLSLSHVFRSKSVAAAGAAQRSDETPPLLPATAAAAGALLNPTPFPVAPLPTTTKAVAVEDEDTHPTAIAAAAATPFMV